MRIVETFNEAKISNEVIEDFAVITPDFVAVIDGASDKTGYKAAGMFGGRLVASVIARVTSDPVDLPATATFEQWVETISQAIDAELAKVGWPDELPRPCACSVTYSRHHREIWRVGDSGYRINGVDFIGGKAIDDHISGIRAAILRAELARGATVDELLRKDVGREAVLPLLRAQFANANNEDSEMGYPVFDGSPIPASMLERPFPVPEGAHVVLFSDGLEFPADTLAETLARQEASYAQDPLRIGLDGAKASTKGLRGVRHDDQTYISFFC